MKLLIAEDCVCLCSNCHVFIHSKFHNLIDEVVSYEDSNFDSKEVCFLIKSTYDHLMKRITEFKIIINRINFSSPLKHEFKKAELWKIHLLQLYCIIIKSLSFTSSELVELLGYQIRTINSFLDNLVKDGFLIKTQSKIFPFSIEYTFTNLGLEVAQELEKKHFNTFQKLRDDLKSMNDVINKRTSWTL